jgi:hypothetical protein
MSNPRGPPGCAVQEVKATVDQLGEGGLGVILGELSEKRRIVTLQVHLLNAAGRPLYSRYW